MGGGKGGSSNDPFPRNMRQARELSQLQQEFFNNALRQTAAFNFFDVVGPFGSRTFEGDPGSENFRQVTTLSPFQQGLMDIGQGQLGALGGVFNQPVGGRDLMQNAEEVEQATFQRGMNLLQPGFDEASSRLENQLVQRGIPRGSEAFTQELDRLGRQQGRQLENLALSSVGAGRSEQSRAIQADLARRQGMMGELGFFGGAGTRPPAFQATPNLQAQAVDPLGAIGMMNQNIANQNQAAANKKAGNMQGISGLGSAGILGMLCSREFKHENREAENVLDKVDQLTVERWQYKGDPTPHIGPYAEEFKELFGVGTDHIISTVDAVGVCLKAIQELSAGIRELKGEQR